MALGGAAAVLVVDDDAGFRALVRELLEGAGHRVVGEARNGAEALLRAKELSPDVITMDLDMPVMNGVAATAALCHGRCAIVIVSGSSSSEDVGKALRAGARWHVAKANVLTQLPQVVAALAAE